tara:strand:+ start:633 stop:1058 length:426 start_codon:yes stop_codon:yes gene_type:complete
MASNEQLKNLTKVIMNGKVGIGDSNPADRLVLKPDSGGNSTLRIDHSNDDNGLRFTSLDTAGFKAGIYWNNSGGQQKWSIIADADGDNSGNLRIYSHDQNKTVMELRFDGKILMPNLPTTNPNVAGAIWNDGGTLKVSSGS